MRPKFNYKIIRFYRDGSNKIINNSVTLAEAQSHCNNYKNSGYKFFDAYCLINGQITPNYANTDTV